MGGNPIPMTLFSLPHALAIAEHVRRVNGGTIAFANGCFDLLHHGHITFLRQARCYGTRLIVGVNSDASVRRLKGPGRPVMPELERAYVLSCIRFVDAVVLFEQDKPLHLIKELAPEVFVTGPPGVPEEALCVEQHGGRVQFVPPTPGVATSHFIERMRNG